MRPAVLAFVSVWLLGCGSGDAASNLEVDGGPVAADTGDAVDGTSDTRADASEDTLAPDVGTVEADVAIDGVSPDAPPPTDSGSVDSADTAVADTKPAADSAPIVDSGSDTKEVGTPTRDPTLWPFASDSPWNMPIGDGAIYETASDACTKDLTDPAISTWINAGDWSQPVYMAKSTDASWTFYPSGYPVYTLHVPSGATPALPLASVDPGTDASMHVIEPTQRWVDEMWRVLPRTGGGWNVGWHDKTDLYGSGLGTGIRAYGGSALGGLIRVWELDAARKDGTQRIPHALAFAQPRSKQKKGWVWPATSEDSGASGTYLGNVPVGQLVAIDPTVDLGKLSPPLSKDGLIIARALQDYGAYDTDSSGDFALSAEPSLESSLGAARTDMKRIRALLRCIKNNTKTSVGGGGVRRAPLAPPLGTPP